MMVYWICGMELLAFLFGFVVDFAVGRVVVIFWFSWVMVDVYRCGQFMMLIC